MGKTEETFTMVIKTDTCYFSEMKIYPGHGSRFVRRDGKLVAFLNAKCMSLYHQKIKAQRLTWTQDWRRLNKKGKVEGAQKKARKRAARTMKPIAGISLAEITAKQSEAKAFRAASRDASARAVKARKAKAKTADAKKADKKEKKRKLAAPRQFKKVPKLRKNLNKPTSA